MNLLTTKQIADRYGIHPKTVLKWVRAEVIPSIPINKRMILFDVDDCDKAIKGRQQ